MRVFLVWAMLLLPAMAQAQLIHGTVTDIETGSAIKAADIVLLGAGGRRIYGVVTDEEGKFQLIVPKGRSVFVQAMRTGYETVTSLPVLVTNAEAVEMSVRLAPHPVPINPVDVVARRPLDPKLKPFYDRAALYKRNGTGHIWTRADLDKQHLPLVSQLLRTVMRRPTMNCTGEVMFIDDLPVDAEDIDLLMAPEDLEGVEMYRNTDIPPDLLYRARLATGHFGEIIPPCMVTMVWRKPYGELHKGAPIMGWHTGLTLVVIGIVALVERAILAK